MTMDPNYDPYSIPEPPMPTQRRPRQVAQPMQRQGLQPSPMYSYGNNAATLANAQRNLQQYTNRRKQEWFAKNQNMFSPASIPTPASIQQGPMPLPVPTMQSVQAGPAMPAQPQPQPAPAPNQPIPLPDFRSLAAKEAEGKRFGMSMTMGDGRTVTAPTDGDREAYINARAKELAAKHFETTELANDPEYKRLQSAIGNVNDARLARVPVPEFEAYQRNIVNQDRQMGLQEDVARQPVEIARDTNASRERIAGIEGQSRVEAARAAGEGRQSRDYMGEIEAKNQAAMQALEARINAKTASDQERRAYDDVNSARETYTRLAASFPPPLSDPGVVESHSKRVDEAKASLEAAMERATGGGKAKPGVAVDPSTVPPPPLPANGGASKVIYPLQDGGRIELTREGDTRGFGITKDGQRKPVVWNEKSKKWEVDDMPGTPAQPPVPPVAQAPATQPAQVPASAQFTPQPDGTFLHVSGARYRKVNGGYQRIK